MVATVSALWSEGSNRVWVKSAQNPSGSNVLRFKGWDEAVKHGGDFLSLHEDGIQPAQTAHRAAIAAAVTAVWNEGMSRLRKRFQLPNGERVTKTISSRRKGKGLCWPRTICLTSTCTTCGCCLRSPRTT